MNFPYRNWFLWLAIHHCSVKSYWTLLLPTSLRAVSFHLSVSKFSSFSAHLFSFVIKFTVMPDSAQDSFPDGGRSSPGSDSSAVQHPPPYDESTYLPHYRAYFDTVRLSMLPCAGCALVVPFGSGVSDTAAGAWWKRWRH